PRRALGRCRPRWPHEDERRTRMARSAPRHGETARLRRGLVRRLVCARKSYRTFDQWIDVYVYVYGAVMRTSGIHPSPPLCPMKACARLVCVKHWLLLLLSCVGLASCEPEKQEPESSPPASLRYWTGAPELLS